MSLKFMLDTNICIFLIKRSSPTLEKKLTSYSPIEIGISSITYAELEYGVSKSQHKEKNALALKKMMTVLQVLDFDSVAAHEYGQIRADLEKQGQLIGLMDMLIGAHALSLGATLVTNNTKEFKRIQKLDLEDWK